MVALQYRIRHRDGHYVTLLDSPCVVRDAAGKVVRIVGVAIDISEQARSQEALRSSQELLQMVAAGTSDWLILVDTGATRAVHQPRDPQAAARKHHRPACWTRLAEPRTGQAVLAALDRVLSTGQSGRPAAHDLRTTGTAAVRSIRAFAPFVPRAASPAP